MSDIARTDYFRIQYHIHCGEMTRNIEIHLTLCKESGSALRVLQIHRDIVMNIVADWEI